MHCTVVPRVADLKKLIIDSKAHDDSQKLCVERPKTNQTDVADSSSASLKIYFLPRCTLSLESTNNVCNFRRNPLRVGLFLACKMSSPSYYGDTVRKVKYFLLILSPCHRANLSSEIVILFSRCNRISCCCISMSHMQWIVTRHSSMSHKQWVLNGHSNMSHNSTFYGRGLRYTYSIIKLCRLDHFTRFTILSCQ